MNFVIYNKDGRILRTGQCPDDHLEQQAQPGEFVIEGIADDMLHGVRDGKIVELDEPAWRPAPNYRQRRADAYPDIREQLDAIWKGGQASADMKALIDAVKADIPKDPA